jgi:hypothetical protein
MGPNQRAVDELIGQFSDRPWRLNNLCFISDKDSRTILATAEARQDRSARNGLLIFHCGIGTVPQVPSHLKRP